MIATCPECGKRYRVKLEKVPERGARITCPSCRHRFVVYREQPKVVIGEPEPQGLPVSIKRQGEITKNAPPEDEPEEDDDESDLPTTVMPFGSSVAADIRQAIAAQYDAPEPEELAPPPPPRSAAPPQATPTPPAADSLRAAASARANATEDSNSIGMLQLVIGIACVAAVMTIAFSLAT